jgi:hypothetical protein
MITNKNKSELQFSDTEYASDNILVEDTSVSKLQTNVDYLYCNYSGLPSIYSYQDENQYTS